MHRRIRVELYTEICVCLHVFTKGSASHMHEVIMNSVIEASVKGQCLYDLSIGTEHEINYVTFEVFAMVTMKSAVFWDIKTQFVPHRRHITSPL
jgi:hypothetical protein